mmetsp:Transcript_58491/g.128236  ORF Transcript_58491/g.128236 Transcript_58491/m.128236 type:complete len:315 (-) Transcript_58491:1846-2790(-)
MVYVPILHGNMQALVAVLGIRAVDHAALGAHGLNHPEVLPPADGRVDLVEVKFHGLSTSLPDHPELIKINPVIGILVGVGHHFFQLYSRDLNPHMQQPLVQFQQRDIPVPICIELEESLPHPVLLMVKLLLHLTPPLLLLLLHDHVLLHGNEQRGMRRHHGKTFLHAVDPPSLGRGVSGVAWGGGDVEVHGVRAAELQPAGHLIRLQQQVRNVFHHIHIPMLLRNIRGRIPSHIPQAKVRLRPVQQMHDVAVAAHGGHVHGAGPDLIYGLDLGLLVQEELHSGHVAGHDRPEEGGGAVGAACLGVSLATEHHLD